MAKRSVKLNIRRGRPGAGEPERLEAYEVEVEEGATLLDALEQLRHEREPELLYRHSCHHGSCGTCGCRVDGTERLACLTRLDELEGEEHTVQPLAGFPVLGDLAIDATPLYRDLPEGFSLLRESEAPPRQPRRPAPPGVATRLRLEDCIECGLCQSTCPAMGGEDGFMGPAALAALDREREKVGAEEAARLLELAASGRGEGRCQRAIDCSRRCPTGVSPARHIATLRKLVADRGRG